MKNDLRLIAGFTLIGAYIFFVGILFTPLHPAYADISNNTGSNASSTSGSSTPAGSNGTVQFNNSGIFGGVSNLTNNTSTGQIKYAGTASDTCPTSISTGGCVNLTNGTDTEALVLFTNIAQKLANLLSVLCNNSAQTQGCVTISSNATSSSPLNVKGTPVNKGVIKGDLNAAGVDQSNAAIFSAQINTTSGQEFFGDAPTGTAGPLMQIRNQGLNKFTVSSSGVIAAAGNASFGGIATSSINGDGTNSFIPNLNTVLNVPSNFATAGCAGSASLTDFGGCVNALYLSASSTASSVVIMVPNITVTQAQWHTPIVFATNMLIPSLICPGGARLMYGGTSTAVTFNFNVSGAHDVSQDWGCTYLGSSTVLLAGSANAATTTGILFGGTTGSNAANGIHFHDNTINGFGSCMVSATNTYMLAITNNAIGGCGSSANQPHPGSLLTFNPASNSGERMVVTGNSFTDPANSTTTNSIYLSDNGNNSTFFSNNSFDDVSIYVGISQALVDFGFNHFENSSPANYSGYYFIIASSSGATTLNVHDNLFANDATTAASNSKGIEHAVNLSFNHNEVNKYGTQTITTFINHDINPGQAQEEACNNWSQNTAVTNWMQLTGTPSLTYPGCFYENANGYPVISSPDGGGNWDFYTGDHLSFVGDINGNWQTLSKGIFGSLKTPSTTLQIFDGTSSSTVQIGDPTHYGCVKYGTPGGFVYQYATTTTPFVISTTTKPAFACQ